MAVVTGPASERPATVEREPRQAGPALERPAGLPIGVVFLALELVTAWSYRSAFAPMLRAKTTPSPVIEKRVALDPIPAR